MLPWEIRPLFEIVWMITIKKLRRAFNQQQTVDDVSAENLARFHAELLVGGLLSCLDPHL